MLYVRGTSECHKTLLRVRNRLYTRQGWRLLIYGALVFAFGYGANRIADALLHGRRPDWRRPTVGIVTFLIALCVLMLAAWIMSKIEGRNPGDYGFPWRRAFCRGQFWQAWVIGFACADVTSCGFAAGARLLTGVGTMHGLDIVDIWVAVGCGR